METPQRRQRLNERDVRLNLAKRDFEGQGWERVGQDQWHRRTNGSVTLSLTLDAEHNRSWRIAVLSETAGQVMNLPFRARSFGAAVAEANRCYNLAYESEEQAEINRQRRLDEHYGREHMGEDDHP